MMDVSRRRLTLSAFNAWHKRPFEYGNADCALFAAHVAKFITGTDFSESFRYQSKAEADSIIATHGGIEGLVRSILGEPSDQLEDGDPILLKLPLVGEALSVKLGDVAVALSEVRLITVSDRYWQMGWHLCRV